MNHLDVMVPKIGTGNGEKLGIRHSGWIKLASSRKYVSIALFCSAGSPCVS